MSLSPEASFTFCLLRPYFDLEHGIDGPLMTWGPLLAYESLAGEEPLPGIQRVLSGAFRRNLIEQTSLEPYAILEPTEVAIANRSSKWQHLCDLTEAFDGLPVDRQVLVARLWIYLGFHALALRRILLFDPAEIAGSQHVAGLARLRAFARYMLYQGHWDSYTPTDLEMIVTHATPLSRNRFYAAGTLLVYHAKVTRDIHSVERCREIMEECIDRFPQDTGGFQYRMDLSRFYRSASYLPFLRGDRARVVSEMDTAEAIARDVSSGAQSWAEKISALENLHPVLESRMREALWLGDLELASDRMQELLQLDPWDAKAHIEYGELLLRCSRFQDAAAEFERGARYGPPGTAVSHFMAGWCYEQLGDSERACDAYLQALSLDPDGTTSMVGLSATAERLGISPLAEWCRTNWRRLDRAGRLSDEDHRLGYAMGIVAGTNTGPTAH